ncbi:MAG: hypothetical protein GYA55_12610 [SAR324 cluster bacterium]|uniref:YbgF trimerisation domain-containing protein n=1 Tax=SAR324 cluster bacterium TaxID=2024889 RepID=A0A7X9FTP2_9DELT|nr:hypothetical protein [SAR324 cluster bacterium]
MRKQWSILFSLIFAYALFAQAENPKLGRTESGKAFRIDSEGNKVVDYIADLESNVEGLQRQVQGLEDELREKVRIIENLQEGRSGQDRIVEKDLVDNSARFADTNFAQSRQIEQASDAASNSAKSQLNFECERTDAIRRAEIASLQDKIKLLEDENSSLSSRLKDPSTTAMLNSRFDMDSQEGDDNRRNLDNSKAQILSLEDEIRMTDERISQLKDELEVKRQEYALLEKEIDSLNKTENFVLKSEDNAVNEAKRGTSEGKSFDSRASLKPDFLTTNKYSYPSKAESDRLQALESLKGSVSTEFNQVKSIISKRDNMLKDYKSQHKTSVAFNPSKPCSSNGDNLRSLHSRLERAQSIDDLSNVKKSLREIETKMNDDIALMQRLKSLP